MPSTKEVKANDELETKVLTPAQIHLMQISYVGKKES